MPISIGEQAMTTSTFYLQPGHPSVYSFPKRLLDIIGSLIGLAILAAIFGPVAIAIELDSPGPIFYSQKRYGLYGRPFTIWKFRSMVAE